jgi:hypothetical protein
MKKLSFVSISLILLAACSSRPTTNIDFNSDTNFQQFTSYQFSPEADTSVDANPVMINRIQTAIDSNLAAKGFTKYDYIDVHSADLTIDVSFREEEKQSDSSFSIGLGTSIRGSHSGSSIGLSTSMPINGKAKIITKIMINMSDANQAIWHGSDRYEASSDLSIAQKSQAVDTTVNRLLATFPPEQNSAKK